MSGCEDLRSECDFGKCLEATEKRAKDRLPAIVARGENHITYVVNEHDKVTCEVVEWLICDLEAGRCNVDLTLIDEEYFVYLDEMVHSNIDQLGTRLKQALHTYEATHG